jgi:predicted RNase H-like HicB family nuclease
LKALIGLSGKTTSRDRKNKMNQHQGIYGYLFAIIVDKGDRVYTATAPGVGGVFEEGATAEEALQHAYESACAILEARVDNGKLIVRSNRYIKVMRRHVYFAVIVLDKRRL